MLSRFELRGSMRYTRWSCLPLGARLALERVILATDREQALFQAALCLHRDLEELLAQVNTINVSEVYLEVDALRPLEEKGHQAAVWNPQPFTAGDKVPPHIKIVDLETDELGLFRVKGWLGNGRRSS